MKTAGARNVATTGLFKNGSRSLGALKQVVCRPFRACGDPFWAPRQQKKSFQKPCKWASLGPKQGSTWVTKRVTKRAPPEAIPVHPIRAAAAPRPLASLLMGV